MKCIIATLIFVFFFSTVSFSQIEPNTAVFFKMTQVNYDSKTGNASDTTYVYYKIDIRGNEIYPYVKASEGEDFFIAREPYRLSLYDRSIFGEIIDPDFPAGEMKELLFTIQEGVKKVLKEPADYPIMFFGHGCSSQYIEEVDLKILSFTTKCYKFRLNDFPSKGYSFVYIDKNFIFPVGFETYIKKKKGEKEMVKHSWFEITKITYL